MASEPLKIAVVSSFLPVLEALQPRITQQIGMPIQLSYAASHELYNHQLQNEHSDYDLIVFAENDTLISPSRYQRLLAVSPVLTSTQVVLWCPSLTIPKRVSLSDSIQQMSIKSISIPDINSSLTKIFIQNIPEIPKSIQLVNARHSLDAWYMAHNKHTECAVTLDKWLNPSDQFSYLSTSTINFRGWIKKNSTYRRQAQQVINILSSPLLQPLMVRAAHSDTTTAPK